MKFKNLEKYRVGGSGTNFKLEVPPPKTPDGRVYRFSPNESAYPRHFVLGTHDRQFIPSEASLARMKIEPRSSQTVCPYSGVIAADQEFTHPDDVKAARAVVEHAVFADAEAEIARMLEGINRSMPQNSLIKIQANVEKKFRPKPRFLRRDLLRELICQDCSRDYGVYALALFCPDCGAPNLRLHFAREAELVGTQADLADSLGEGKDELAYRLLGNAQEDVLTAFEATLKAVYLHGVAQHLDAPQPAKPVKNDFQNIDIAAKRFAELNLDPFDHLSKADLATLNLNIQKRHIIGHNLGVIDDKFATHAQDAKLGETVHLVGEDIGEFAKICQRVVDRLDDWLAGISGEAAPASDKKAIESPKPRVVEPVDELDADLSPLARRVGLWIAEHCPDGLNSFVNEQALADAFSGGGIRDLQDAIAELEAEGLVSCSHTISKALPHVRPTTDLYVTFDPLAYGHNPASDAAELTTRVLAGEDSVGVAELYAATDWPLRRFNPAVALVIAQVDSRRVSGEMSGDYPCRWFHLMAGDRVALKRFAARLKQA